MTSNIPQRLIALLLAATTALVLVGCNRGDEAPPETYTPAAAGSAAGPDGGPSAADATDDTGALVDLPADDEAAAEAGEDDAPEGGDEEAAEEGAEGSEAEEGAEGAEGDESGGEDEEGAEDEGGDEPPAENGGAEEQPPADEEDETPEPPADEGPYVNPDIDAAALYRTTQCGFCHGDDLKGARQGPPLTDLDRYWDTRSLAGFLRDPAEYADNDQRLIELGRQYNFAMLGTRLSEENRIALAHWLLQQ